MTSAPYSKEGREIIGHPGATPTAPLPAATRGPTRAAIDITPRGLRREMAARYVGVSPTKFDELVDDGRMPDPKRVDGCVIWDRHQLDEAFDALPTQHAENEWDSVLKS